MEYTVQKLAKLAGVSTRTLRYYDEIGLLKPQRINSAGYRIYGQTQVDMLQHILFYRELEFSLEDIQSILNNPQFDENKALQAHQERLLAKKAQLEELIQTVNQTIALKEGRINMTDKDKFKGFKQEKLEENEAKYGKEIREKYGEEVVKKSNEKFMNMTEAQYAEVTQLQDAFTEKIRAAFLANDATGEDAMEAADLHRRWLCYFWPEGTYSKESHMGLAQMYVDDERFTAHYDAIEPGLAVFLKEVIDHYCLEK